jgi:4-amino-4-deoxy-L-arabinose transferase-like glycosyltransferase
VSDARLSGVLVLVALLVRLIAWLGAPIFGTDGCHYLLMADWLRSGRFSDALGIAYHPLYPLLITMSNLPLGNTAAAGALVSVVLGAAAVLPLFRLAKELFGRPEAFVTGLLYAFNPSVIEVQADVMTEGAFMFFFFVSIWGTWRQVRDPHLSRAVMLAVAAAAAYLTRPEGTLAVAFGIGWPIAAALFSRGRRGTLLAGALVSAVVVLLLAYPYLSWIRSIQGHWALSPRSALASVATSAESLLGADRELSGRGVFVTFAHAIYRMTYLVTIPFYLIGFVVLARRPSRSSLFLLSYPFAYLAAVAFTLRVYNFMSPRYVIPAMSVLMVVAAVGITRTIRWLDERRPAGGVVPLLGPALLVAIAVLPCVKVLSPNRWECRSYYDAARWIQDRGQPRALSGPVQQVAYLTSCRSVYSATTSEALARQVSEAHVDYYVYTEKDLEKRPTYVAMLRSSPDLEPPVEIIGAPGTLKVYIQKAK